MEIKYQEFNEQPKQEQVESYTARDKDNLKQLGIAGSAVAEVEEDNFEFEQQPTTKELQKIEEEEEKHKWTPDEQFRLLYSYFKDMSVEPLLTAKESVIQTILVSGFVAVTRTCSTGHRLVRSFGIFENHR